MNLINHRFKLWFCIICTILSTITISAQTKNDTITGKVHKIKEVTISGRKTPKTIVSSSPFQYMKKDEMQRMGISDISDAMKHFSGVSIKDYGGIGGLKTVSIRSLGAQHTSIAYDGVQISDCQSGQVDISRFSLDNVSSLSMSIGQDDNIYQSAKLYASAGNVNIETTKPDFTNNNQHININTKIGSFGLINPSLFYSQKVNNGIAFTAYANYLHADGNYPFKMWNNSHLIDSKRNNSDIESYRAELNIFSKLNDRKNLDIKFYLFDSKRGLPGGIIYDNPYAAERLYDRNYFGHLKYENRISNKFKFKLLGKLNYSWNRDYNDESSGITDDKFRQTESYISGVMLYNPLKYFSISLSQDFSYNYLSTSLSSCQYPKRFTYLTALAANYKNDRINASASLLNTHITEDVRIGKSADDRKKLSPAISVSYRPFDFGLRLRASYKDIFRTPTFNDLYYAIIGNSNLKAESTKQLNIGATYDISSLGLFDFISLSVDGYYNRVKDKIVAVPTMFVWKMMNLGKVETIGTDLNLSAKASLTGKYKLYASGTYNYMQAEDITDKNSLIWRNQIIYTPKHSGSGSITIENPFVNITYNLLYASVRYRLAMNIKENRVEPYTDHGISLSHMFKFKKQSLKIQFDALNLSNKNYEIIRFYPMAGRNYKITINYNI